MFRRRKKRNKTENGAQPESPAATSSPNSATPSTNTVRNCPETKKPPFVTDAFRDTIEKAADRSRSELVSEGKIKPMAFFVHADGTMKTVSLSIKDEHQKEALIKRVREKVLAENILTVIVLTEIDHEMVLSGASSDMRASARVDYSFDNKTKTVTSWKLSWLNRLVQNVFLNGIFDKTH
jgi:hypothetical protein